MCQIFTKKVLCTILATLPQIVKWKLELKREKVSGRVGFLAEPKRKGDAAPELAVLRTGWGVGNWKSGAGGTSSPHLSYKAEGSWAGGFRSSWKALSNLRAARCYLLLYQRPPRGRDCVLLWRLILCINMSRPWDTQVFDQTLHWAFLSGCFKWV